MRNVFLDTNILIDVIADRKPFSKPAIVLFQKAEAHQIRLHTSSHSIATTHYLLKKYLDEQTLRETLLNLTELVHIIPVNLQILRKALQSAHKDFEDSIQMYCASGIPEMEAIITRNIKDFKDSEIPVYAADEYCLML